MMRRMSASPSGSAAGQSKKSLSTAPLMPAAAKASPDSSRAGSSSASRITASAMHLATTTRKSVLEPQRVALDLAAVDEL